MNRIGELNGMVRDKENMMPLRESKAPGGLVGDSSIRKHPQTMEEQRQRFENQIEWMDIENHNDPLSIHIEYLHWLKHESQAGHAEYMKILERAVRLFRKDDRFKSDHRYLTLWLEVASNTKEPIDVFKYLSSNRIGITLAAYYLAYAQQLSSKRKWQEAIDILELGLSRRVDQPEKLMEKLEKIKLQAQMTGDRDQRHQTDALHASRSMPSDTCRTAHSSQKKEAVVSKIRLQEHSSSLQVFDDACGTRLVRNDIGRTEEPQSEANRKQPNTSSSQFSVFSNEQQAVCVSTKEKQAPGSAPKERIVCDLDILYIGDEEFSLEELRALQMGYGLIDTCDGMSANEKIPQMVSSSLTFAMSVPLASLEVPAEPADLSHANIPPTSIISSLLMDTTQVVRSGQGESPTMNSRIDTDDTIQRFNQAVVENTETEDMTISSKVFKPEIVSFTIPTQMDEHTANRLQFAAASAAMRLNVYSDDQENAVAAPHAPPAFMPVRKPLTSKPLDNDDEQPKSESPALKVESTPYRRRGTNAPSFSSYGFVMKRIPQNFDLMTPIAEASFYDERTIAGLSTIKNVRVQDMMGDPTATSIADRSILLADRTFGQFDVASDGHLFSGDTRHQLGTLNEDEEEDIDDMDIRNLDLGHEDMEDDKHEYPPTPIKSNSFIEPREATPAKARSHQANTVREYQTESSLENPCNPRSRAVLMNVLARGLSFLMSLDTLHDHRMIDCPFTSQLDSLKPTKPVQLTLSESFDVISKIGEGAFAKIYLLKQESLSDGYDSDEEAEMKLLSALKIQKTVFPWEFYILSKLHSKLPSHTRESVIIPYSCHAYQDSVCMRLQYLDQGTLVDCLNHAVKDGFGGTIGTASSLNFAGVDELLAMFWIVELMRTLEHIHSCGIIHGDLKADNVLARVKDHSAVSENKYDGAWDSMYQPDGSGGWLSRGISLLDWGSAVDASAFSPDQKFVTPNEDGLLKPKETLDAGVECWELRNGYPWKYEADWYGLAGIAHVLLFGKYMTVSEGEFPVENGHLSRYDSDALNADVCPYLTQNSPLKRYWQVSLWTRFFDVLMNAGAYNRMMLKQRLQPALNAKDSREADVSSLLSEFPILADIRSLRHEMEDWLQANCNKAGKSLKNLLRKVQVSAMERHMK